MNTDDITTDSITIKDTGNSIEWIEQLDDMDADKDQVDIFIGEAKTSVPIQINNDERGIDATQTEQSKN